MSFTQLNPTLPLAVEGEGYAIAVIDYGKEHSLIRVTVMDETGEISCAPNPKVRVQLNWTLGRMPGSQVRPDA